MALFNPCTLDEYPNLGYDSKKVKKFGPQTGFEPTPLKKMSFQVESSTTELQRHPNKTQQNLESRIFYVFFRKKPETETDIPIFPLQVRTSSENQKVAPGIRAHFWFFEEVSTYNGIIAISIPVEAFQYCFFDISENFS